MRWVTQARPKIDRLASPWLISRFVDPQAQFLFVPAADIRNTAASTGAIPFDVPLGTPETDLAHPPGGTCFDVIRAKFALNDPALARMAAIVHDADNDNRVGRMPEAAGLRAISLGLANTVRDDQERLAYAMVLYDSLYRWVSRGPDNAEVFARAPALYRAAATIGGWISLRRERRALADLDDRLLRDVGLTREEAEHEFKTPCWRMSRRWP
jgi:uncharacterized protein YjiS (DUF1127 family)